MPTIVYEALDLVIDEESNSEIESYPFRDELDIHDIEIDITVVFETLDEEE